MTSGTFNTSLGTKAGDQVTTGSRNVTIGCCVQVADATGNCQFIIGVGSNKWICGDSSFNIYDKDGNQLNGGSSGLAQDGQGNLYAGDGAGNASDADTCFNIAFGCNALNSNCAGDMNVAIGRCAMKCTLSGGYNIAIGCEAGCKISTGSFNIALGKGAMSMTGVSNNLCGSSNIGIGLFALAKNCTGRCHIAIGHNAACNVTGEYSLIAIGTQAGLQAGGGKHNMMIGHQAGCGASSSSTIGDDNIFIGKFAGRMAAGDSNIFMGVEAGDNFAATTACHNIGIGCQALHGAGSGSTGKCNVAIGLCALANTCSGSRNISIGERSMLCSRCSNMNIAIGVCAGRGSHVCSDGGTGNSNVFIGRYAGFEFQTGAYNTVVGDLAGRHITVGRDNTYIGKNTGNNHSTGCKNTIIGKDAFVGVNEGTNTGGCNTIIGEQSGCSLTTGGSNTFLGQRTSRNVTTGSCNIAIGAQVCLPSAVADKQLAVGINTGRWISGNPSFNVGVGTDVGVGTTARARLYVEGSVHASRFFQNPTQLLSNTTFPEEGGTANGGVFGPYTLATGVTLTISSGSTFTII